MSTVIEAVNNLTHNELIQKLISRPEDVALWQEFYSRYHDHICACIVRECRQKDRYDWLSDIDDMAQDVYVNLMKKELHVLKSFKGAYENSIFKYLGMVAFSVVQGRISTENAQKRGKSRKPLSIHASAVQNNHNMNVTLENIIEAKDWDSSLRMDETIGEIRLCLNKILGKRRNRDMYRVIVNLWLFEDISAEKIHEKIAEKLALQRVRNVITETKKDLQKCLASRLL